MQNGGKGFGTPSLKDVAERAGASRATVSRVLSNSGPASEAMRRRVLEAARETGYVRNAAACALGRRRRPRPGLAFNTVALALPPKVQGPPLWWEETCEGVLLAAEDLGVNVVVCMIKPEAAQEGLAPSALTQTPVDGIIVKTRWAALAKAMQGIAPTILVGSPPAAHLGFPLVDSDNEEGVRRLVEHLASLGHERLQFAPWDMEHFPYVVRAEACRKAAQSLGLVAEVAAPVNGRCEEYVREFLELPDGLRPTAIVASCDGMAIEVLHELLTQGVRVPEEVSVVGFDGLPWGAQSVPPLTSWRVHWQDMGRIALETLLRLLEGGPVPIRTLTGGDLLVRGSSGPAPKAVGREGAPCALKGVLSKAD